MKKISQPQQFRHVTGEFLAKQDKMSGDARQQQDNIIALAKHPGRNSSNANRQDLAHSILNMISLLSTVQPTPDFIHTPASINTTSSSSLIPNESVPSHTQNEALADRVTLSALLNPNMQSGNLAESAHAAARRLRRQDDPLLTPAQNQQQNVFVTDSVHNQREPERLIDRQNAVLDAWLQEMNLKPNTTHKFSRVNKITDYMAENVNERVADIAKLLLIASNSYGAEEGETLLKTREWKVIIEYYNNIIFGTEIDSWLLQQILKINKHDNYLLHHANLQRTFTHVLNARSDGAKLSFTARKFYQENILANLLPTFMLQLNPQEQSELAKMDISKVQWGFIHVGAKLLKYFGSDFSKVQLEELAEIGVIIDSLLRQGVIPQEYADLFFLPALFYHAKKTNQINIGTKLSAKEKGQIIKQYFAYSAKWIKQNNPVALLPDLIKQWKSRPALAREILSEKQIPLAFLKNYLNQHSAASYYNTNGALINIPDVDKIFDLQNQKIEKTACDADKLIMPLAFDKVSHDTQQFIANALINRVQARFSAAKALQGIPMSVSAKKGMSDSGAMEYYIPDKYDLLQCINNGEERIYILQIRKNGEYSLTHADSLRTDMLWLLDNIPPGGIDDYELKLSFDKKLKNKEEPPSKLIQKLATLHGAKLRAALAELGYQKTTDEKVKDFLLSLVPFYTCISESIKGNSEAAIPACVVDVLSLVPFAAGAVKTGLHFGTALAKTTALALTWSTRQATLKNMLRQAGQIYVYHFPSIAEKISPRVMQNLGVIFLRSIDPGFELIAKGTINGAKALEKVLSKMQHTGRGLTDLKNSLKRLIDVPLPEIDAGKYQSRTLFSELHGRELDLAAIAKQDGKQVWVQFDSESGELFGRKYFITDQNSLEPVPFSLATRLKKIKTEGLGGKGAAKKTWADDDQIAGPSNANHRRVPMIKTHTINNLPVRISTYGETGSEKLLFPEFNQISLRTTPIDIAQYEQSLSTLSPLEQAALTGWLSPGEPLFVSSDGTVELVRHISLDINEKLFQGQPLTPYEFFIYENLISAIDSHKISGIPGDYLHMTQYKSGVHNPWISGAITEKDYVTTFPMIMSFSADQESAIAAMNVASGTVENIDSFVIYQIEGAKSIFPVISTSLTFSGVENDFIYSPRMILKVKSISISLSDFPVEIMARYPLQKVRRIGVVLTEVDAAEADLVTPVKNIFSGMNFEFSTIQPFLPACNIIPSLPHYRTYWDGVREMITAPLIPPPSAKKYYTIQKLEKFIPEIPLLATTDVSIIDRITDKHVHSYLGNNNWRAYIGLSGNVPPEISWIQGIIREHCEESLRKLAHVDTILSNTPIATLMESDIGKYIIGLTPTTNPKIVTEVFHRISNIFKRARIFMEAAKNVDYGNFIIIATDLVPVPDTQQRYISLLSNEQLSTIPKACVHKFDPEFRILLFADQFIGNSPEAKGNRLSLHSSNQFKIHQTIIHESTHLTSVTSDIFAHATHSPAFPYSALYARYNLIRALTPSTTAGESAPIWKKPNFVEFMQNVVNFQNVKKKINFNSALQSINKDPMLFANIFYSDAEVLALIANDIDAKRTFDALVRTRRDLSNSPTADQHNTSDVLPLLAFFLDATTHGLIQLSVEKTDNEIINQPLQILKNMSINGVSMNVQIYGDSDNSELLFPERHQGSFRRISVAKKSLNQIIPEFSQHEQEALTQWREFSDQHPLMDSTEVKPTINQKIILGETLNANETMIYANALAALTSGQLPGVAGDFLRTVSYKAGENNPWLNDLLDVNDCLTNAKAFMSVGSDTQYTLDEITDIANPAKDIASIVFYKIENGTRAMPILPLESAPENAYGEYLYPPDSLFRVKNLAVSVPVSTTAGYNNSDLYQAQRVAVTLTEVDAEEAKNVTTIKNIFDGSATHYLI